MATAGAKTVIGGGGSGFAPGQIFDVKAYGARGNGVADDSLAIWAALGAARLVKGTVYFPAGNYLVHFQPHPVTSGFYCAIWSANGMTLVGAGPTATTITLAAGQTFINTSMHLHLNYQLNPSISTLNGDTGMVYRDLTMNGNSANQSFDYEGFTILRTTQVAFERVHVKNVHGSATSGAAETFHFNAQNSFDVSYLSCEAFSDDAGPSATGLAANFSTMVRYVDCKGYKMSVSMGYSHFECTDVVHVGCSAWSNGDNGFNSEASADVSYTDCTAGTFVAPFNQIASITSTPTTFTITFNGPLPVAAGQVITLAGFTPSAYNGAWTIASTNAGAQTATVTSALNPGNATTIGTWSGGGAGNVYPFASQTQLGNVGSGFESNGATRAQYTNCTGLFNGTGIGVTFQAGYPPPTDIRINGGMWQYNGVGVSLNSADFSNDTASSTRIAPGTQIINNGVDLSVQPAPGDISNANFFHTQSVVSIPASGAPTIANPFACDARVYLVGTGTITNVELSNQACGPQSHFIWAAGQGLQLTYTGTLDWVIQLSIT